MAFDPLGSVKKGVQNIKEQGWVKPWDLQGDAPAWSKGAFYGGAAAVGAGVGLGAAPGVLSSTALRGASLAGRVPGAGAASSAAARAIPGATRLAGTTPGGAVSGSLGAAAGAAKAHPWRTAIGGAIGGAAGYNVLANRGGGTAPDQPGVAPFGAGGEGRWQELGLPSFGEAIATLDLSTLVTDDDWLQAANEMFEAYGESGRQWVDQQYAQWQQGGVGGLGEMQQPDIVTLPETGQQGYWTYDSSGQPQFQVLQGGESWQDKQAQAEWMAAPQNWIEVAMQRGETPLAPEAVSRYTPGLEAGQELSPEALHQMQVMSPAQWAQMSPVEQAQIRGFLESGRGGYTPAGLQQQISRLAAPGGRGPMTLSYE